MKDTIKCPHCGSLNIKGASKCTKCLKRLDNLIKSCPKCAKRNKSNALKCVSCGYNFNNTSISVLIINALLSILVVIILCSLIYLRSNNIITNHLSLIIKIVGGLGILLLIIATLTNGKKDIYKFDKTDSISNNKFNKFKTLSYTSFYVGIVLLIILLVYLYITIV